MPTDNQSSELDADETHVDIGRGGPFTASERRSLRDIIERDSKARWLASTIRAWGAWAAAVLVGIMAFSDGLKKALRDWLS